MDVASELLQSCMKKDPNLMEAHLLMAQLHLMQDNIRQSTASIEMALSSNFEVLTSRVLSRLHEIVCFLGLFDFVCLLLFVVVVFCFCLFVGLLFFK